MATYLRVWHALHESAVDGADAQNSISRLQRSVGGQACPLSTFSQS
ncbi:hypothetical protein ACFXPV_12330 [Streptomyces sp. NPDC059118]